MDPVVISIVAGVGALGALATWWSRVAARKSRSAIQYAAEELGLLHQGGNPGTLAGEVDGVPVAGVNTPGTRGRPGYRILVRNLPATIGIRPVSGIRPAQDIETGDEAFDRAMRVDGETAVALAILDAPTREILTRTVGRMGGAMRLDFGILAIEYADSPFDGDGIVKDIRALAEAATAIRSRYAAKGRAHCLAENVESDPIPAVRHRNLEALLEHRDAEPAKRAFEAALAHGNAASRLVGAIGLGDAGALRQLAVSGEIAPLQRSRAALALAELLPDDQAETALLHILPSLGDVDAERPVIELLGRIGTAKSVELLRERAGVLTAIARAASSAVAQIQSRISGGAPGQMSLVAPSADAGAVSVADAEAGALSPAIASAKPKPEAT